MAVVCAQLSSVIVRKNTLNFSDEKLSCPLTEITGYWGKTMPIRSVNYLLGTLQYNLLPINMKAESIDFRATFSNQCAENHSKTQFSNWLECKL